MIHENELRIGNYVSYEDGFVQCIQNGFEIDEGTELFPVTLTEEWLIKLGFDKSDRRTDWDLKLHISSLTLYCRYNTEWYFQLEDIYLGALLKSVHQVQNFCAVFGKELEVKS